jgi:uncharacterized protein YbdZ (MbtH family)
MSARPAQGLSHLAGRIIVASMAALLSPVQEGDLWRVKIVWPNGRHTLVGKFTSEQDAIDWINAHPQLTKPEDTMDEPQIDDAI